MPRRSAASLSVVPFAAKSPRPKLTPPIALTKEQRSLFTSTAASNAHLRECDSPQLAAYVQALTKCYALAKKSDAQSISSYEKVSRIAAMWAVKLRITVQSQVLPDFAGRKRNVVNSQRRVPWDRTGEDDEPPFSRAELGDDEDAAG